MPPPMRDVIHFIREHRIQGDLVAFDFLLWQESAMSVYLLDPSQFSRPADDPEVVALVPEHSRFPNERRWTAYKHAFIHARHPRFLVLAGTQLRKDIQKRQKIEKDLQSDVPIDSIRAYLTPVDGTESQFRFQSPYVLPEAQILFTKIYENDSFVVMEREGSGAK